jgi:type II secretory pathway component PulM
MRARRAFAWAGAVVVLALVFLAYLTPQLAMTLATQLWNCF